jgi:hypothetical protein
MGRLSCQRASSGRLTSVVRRPLGPLRNGAVAPAIGHGNCGSTGRDPSSSTDEERRPWCAITASKRAPRTRGRTRKAALRAPGSHSCLGHSHPRRQPIPLAAGSRHNLHPHAERSSTRPPSARLPQPDPLGEAAPLSDPISTSRPSTAPVPPDADPKRNLGLLEPDRGSARSSTASRRAGRLGWLRSVEVEPLNDPFSVSLGMRLHHRQRAPTPKVGARRNGLESRATEAPSMAFLPPPSPIRCQLPRRGRRRVQQLVDPRSRRSRAVPHLHGRTSRLDALTTSSGREPNLLWSTWQPPRSRLALNEGAVLGRFVRLDGMVGGA